MTTSLHGVGLEHARRAGVILSSAGALATAVWLMPATVQIAEWPPGGPVRLALFQPLSALLLVVGVALVAGLLLLVATRGDDVVHVLAPLSLLWVWTLPYWPWLPDRAPLLLAIAGPLRWVFAAAAAAGVMYRAGRAASLRLPGRAPAGLVVFVVSFALYAVLGLYAEGTLGPGGDEPHYLIITHSLLVDHDLEIENNYANRDYGAFFRGNLQPDYMVRGRGGEIFPIHGPGLPVLLLPGYAAAGLQGAVLTMALFGALAALGIFRLAALVGGIRVAWWSWAALCLTVPFIPHAWAIFPEMAAAAIVAWALVWSVEPLPKSAGAWIWRGAVLAALPWLHTKFVVFLVALAVILALRLRSRLAHAAALLAPMAVSCTAWLAYFWVLWGSIDPEVPYGTYTAQFVRFENIPRSLLGTFVDQKFGLFVYAPIYLAVLPGAWRIFRDRQWRWLGVAASAVAAVYILSSARLYMWWGGSSAPARFLVPVVPLLAPFLAGALSDLRSVSLRAGVATALGLSILLAALGAVAPGRLYLFSEPHGYARLIEAVQGSAPLARSLPTFTNENWVAPFGATLPWLVAALVAAATSWLMGRRSKSAFWTGTAGVLAFALVGSLGAPTPAPDVRADASRRGSEILLTVLDPGLRAFDYSRWARADTARVLAAASESRTRELGELDGADARHLAGPFSLPAGRYRARLWFDDMRARTGTAVVTVGHLATAAKLDGPLPNPATLEFDLAFDTAVWVGTATDDLTRNVTRADVIPLEVAPPASRPSIDVRAIEPAGDRPGAMIVYTDDHAYPEGGVFWTRGTEETTVQVSPSGASELVFTLHVGPSPTQVRLLVGGQDLSARLVSGETRAVAWAVPPNTTLVSVHVAASTSFRPIDAEPGSDDTRSLGCQVRITAR